MSKFRSLRKEMDIMQGLYGSFGLLVYFAVLMGLMYLMIILPQKRRDKKVREMLDKVKVGDDIVTIGGIEGKVVNIKDDTVTIESSAGKTMLRIKKWAIREIVNNA